MSDPQRLSPDNDSKRHIPVLDGFRGIAVLLVFCSHVFYETCSDVPLLNALTFNAGFYGVSLFFVLSGFLVSSPFVKYLLHEGPAVSLKKFYTNRFLRILPLFYITAAFFFAVHMITETQTTIYKEAIPYYLLLLQNISESVNIVDPPTWSISVEFHFYLLVGLGFAFFKNNNVKRTMVALIVILVLVNIYKLTAFFFIQSGHSYRDLIYANSFANLDFFAAGIILCIVHHQYKDALSTNKRAVYIYSGLAILTLTALYLYEHFKYGTYSSDLLTVVVSPIITALGWWLMIFGLLRSNSLGKRIIASRFLSFYGKISYSLYLLHVPLYTLFYRPYFLKHITPDLVLISASYFVVITGISFLSYRFIESPFLRFKNKNYRKGQVSFRYLLPPKNRARRAFCFLIKV